MENKPIDNSLPIHLKMYINKENSKYLKKDSMASKDVYKNMMDNLSLIELQEYKESMKEGQSYWYNQLKTSYY